MRHSRFTAVAVALLRALADAAVARDAEGPAIEVLSSEDPAVKVVTCTAKPAW